MAERASGKLPDGTRSFDTLGYDKEPREHQNCRGRESCGGVHKVHDAAQHEHDEAAKDCDVHAHPIGCERSNYGDQDRDRVPGLKVQRSAPQVFAKPSA